MNSKNPNVIGKKRLKPNPNRLSCKLRTDKNLLQQQSDGLDMGITVPMDTRLRKKISEDIDHAKFSRKRLTVIDNPNQESSANRHFTQAQGTSSNGFPGVLRKDRRRSLDFEVKQSQMPPFSSSTVGGCGQLLTGVRCKHGSPTSSSESIAALESIRGQGNMNATLKEEKHRLVKEQGRQAALGQTMEAVELVKQKLNTTRMETLAQSANRESQKLEARLDIESPIEVQIELKQRLVQMTDCLVQKQAQVEALTSEILLGIQDVSRLLDESKSTTESRDIESGRPLLHQGSVLHQLHSIFLAAAAFLRKSWPFICYLWLLLLACFCLCLLFRVIWSPMAHSQASNEISSVTVVSLQNIHNSSGEVFVCMGCTS